MEANNMAAMREALELFAHMNDDGFYDKSPVVRSIVNKSRAALAAPPRTGKWMNGRKYEYEYAYCSECGRMQWADWDTHKQAEESIGSFADNYKFCPGCGAKMEGGVYVK